MRRILGRRVAVVVLVLNLGGCFGGGKDISPNTNRSGEAGSTAPDPASPETSPIPIASVEPAVPPEVISVSPVAGRAGTTVTISGKRFRDGATIQVGETACSSSKILSETSATCLVAATLPGHLDVKFINPDKQSGVLKAGFDYASNVYLYDMYSTPQSTKLYLAKIDVANRALIGDGNVDLPRDDWPAYSCLPENPRPSITRNGNLLIVAASVANTLLALELDDASGRILRTKASATDGNYPGNNTVIPIVRILYNTAYLDPARKNLYAVGINMIIPGNSFFTMNVKLTPLRFDSVSLAAALNSAGAATEAVYSPAGGNCTSNRNVLFDPTGKFLYVPRSVISTYGVNTTTGALQLLKQLSTNVDTLTASADGKQVYAYLSLIHPYNVPLTVSDKLLGFSANPTTGDLAPLPGSPYTITGIYEALIHPNGKFLFVATKDQVAMYKLDQNGAPIVPALAKSAIVANPNAMRLDASGNFLVVTSATAPGISLLRLDLVAGAFIPFNINVTGLPTRLWGAETF